MVWVDLVCSDLWGRFSFDVVYLFWVGDFVNSVVIATSWLV